MDTPIERAFTVFTSRFCDFKPPEHNLLRAPSVETVFEQRVGGGIVGDLGCPCWQQCSGMPGPRQPNLR